MHAIMDPTVEDDGENVEHTFTSRPLISSDVAIKDNIRPDL